MSRAECVSPLLPHNQRVVKNIAILLISADVCRVYLVLCQEIRCTGLNIAENHEKYRYGKQGKTTSGSEAPSSALFHIAVLHDWRQNGGGTKWDSIPVGLSS